jgi:toxin CcdB
MPRFTVYRNARDSGKEIPYLLDVQADWVTTGSRVVVPLIPARKYGPVMAKLNPVFDIAGERHVLATADIAAIPARDLKIAVDDLTPQRDQIVTALDFLFQGY